ncbi:MAG: 2-C-methyl-D-erythritol 4-phosphate cytidylyltransferase [Gammaproteobacteria bacterium]|jgi:2-C-methyl-D-erythritol 4-phosphate cytidylyltransferase
MTPVKNNLWAIVPAAGIGQRMGATLPKQYVNVNHKPILAHTLDVICQIPHLKKVIVALHPEDHYWSKLISPYDKIMTVIGGEVRNDSVLNALNAIKNEADAQDWVLVHDAVRPCITVDAICKLLAEIHDHPVGGLWGVPVRDTLKQVDNQHNVEKTIPREFLWHAQTPQIFRFGLLYKALQTVKQDNINITDDANAIEYLGYHPKMVRGSYTNIKMTWPEDLILAEHWFKHVEVNS